MAHRKPCDLLFEGSGCVDPVQEVQMVEPIRFLEFGKVKRVEPRLHGSALPALRAGPLAGGSSFPCGQSSLERGVWDASFFAGDSDGAIR